MGRRAAPFPFESYAAKSCTRALSAGSEGPITLAVRGACFGLRSRPTPPTRSDESAMSPQPDATSPRDEHVAASVLVPVLNEERHIRTTVAAMQSQRLDGRLEFLFMDGRSDDATRAILEELAAGDPRIRVLDNPKRRTTDALNIGLANARGEYVVRMDAHGIYPPDYIALGIDR